MRFEFFGRELRRRRDVEARSSSRRVSAPARLSLLAAVQTGQAEVKNAVNYIGYISYGLVASAVQVACPPARSSAARTRSGVIGMRVMRTPVALAIALATAAAGGTIGTSPTPRTP